MVTHKTVNRITPMHHVTEFKFKVHKKPNIPPTINNVPVIQKLAYIHKIRIAKSPTIKIPGV